MFSLSFQGKGYIFILDFICCHFLLNMMTNFETAFPRSFLPVYLISFLSTHTKYTIIKLVIQFVYIFVRSLKHLLAKVSFKVRFKDIHSKKLTLVYTSRILVVRNKLWHYVGYAVHQKNKLANNILQGQYAKHCSSVSTFYQ